VLRLVKWYPDQIAKAWPTFRPIIDGCLPPIAGHKWERMERVFESILAGKLDLYIFVDIREDIEEPQGLLVTAIVDTVDGTERTLLVYALYSFIKTDAAKKLEAIELIKKLARGEGCASFSGYTNIPVLIDYVKAMGGEVSTCVRLEV
jgi:hypothetical protein